MLVSSSGQEKFAKGLFNAFEAYKKDFERGGVSRPAKDVKPAGQVNPSGGRPVQHDVKVMKGSPSYKAAGGEFYAVQILSVGKKLAVGAYDLKGRKDAKYIQVGKLYKYYIGNYATRAEAAKALAEVRKSFPGAFVIHVKDNNIVK